MNDPDGFCVHHISLEKAVNGVLHTNDINKVTQRPHAFYVHTVAGLTVWLAHALACQHQNAEEPAKLSLFTTTICIGENYKQLKAE